MAIIRNRLPSLSLTLSFPPIDPVRKAMQGRADHFSNLVAWSTAIVAFGVAMEAVEIIHDVRAWWKGKRREKRERRILDEVAEIFPSGRGEAEKELESDHPRWVKRLLRLGLIMVVIGVVGEWGYGAKLEDAHNAIHEYDVAKLIAAEREAVQARAWVLHLKPRYTSFDVRKVVESLKGVPPQKVEILYTRENEEAYTLARRIASSLGPGKGNAGWDVSEPRPVSEKDAFNNLAPRDATPECVPLILRAGSGSGGIGVIAKYIKATGVSGLIEALANSGAFTVVEGHDEPDMPDDLIRIVIGTQVG